MSEPIQLLPGLLIHFAADGEWLHFEGHNHKGAIHLANTLSHTAAGNAVSDWVQRIRDSRILE